MACGSKKRQNCRTLFALARVSFSEQSPEKTHTFPDNINTSFNLQISGSFHRHDHENVNKIVIIHPTELKPRTIALKHKKYTKMKLPVDFQKPTN